MERQRGGFARAPTATPPREIMREGPSVPKKDAMGNKNIRD